jgi:hypothetical protein
MAACYVMRSLVGGLAPLFSHKMYQKLDVGWSFSLLAFIALALTPVRNVPGQIAYETYVDFVHHHLGTMGVLYFWRKVAC